MGTQATARIAILWAITCVLTLVDSGGLLSASAMENHSGVLRNQHGRAIGGATVTVYNAGTTTLATIYSNNGVTAKSNPFLTDTFDGRYNFYAANGTYDIVYRFPGATFDAAHTKRIGLFDQADFVASGGGATGIIFEVVAVSANATLSGTHKFYHCDATAGNITLTIPLASAQIGANFRIKKTDTTANKCVLSRSGSDLINLDPTLDLDVQGDAVEIVSRAATIWDIF